MSTSAQNVQELPVASRFFVAKHIPDLLRYEPRNVGVILWTPYGAASRFVGERADGTLDLRCCPPFVEDAQIYKQWVDYWRGLLKADVGLQELVGPLERIDDANLPKLLTRASKEHWLLAPGGVIFDPIAEKDSLATLQRLFSEIISIENTVIPAETVEKIVRAVVRALSLNTNPNFHEHYRLKVPKTGDELHFDYAFAGKKVERLWQQMPTMPRPAQLEPYAEATAFKFDQARHAFGLAPEKLCAVISMTGSQEKANANWLRLVGRYAQIYNLHDPQARIDAFGRLPHLDPLEGTDLSPGLTPMRPPKKREHKKAHL